jgi:hypothetical protein
MTRMTAEGISLSRTEAHQNDPRASADTTYPKNLAWNMPTPNTFSQQVRSIE